MKCRQVQDNISCTYENPTSQSRRAQGQLCSKLQYIYTSILKSMLKALGTNTITQYNGTLLFAPNQNDMVHNVCVCSCLSHANFIDRRKGSLSFERYRKIYNPSTNWRTHAKTRDSCSVASKRPCATFSAKSWHKLIHACQIYATVPFLWIVGCYNLHIPHEITSWYQHIL